MAGHGQGGECWVVPGCVGLLRCGVSWTCVLTWEDSELCGVAGLNFDAALETEAAIGSEALWDVFGAGIESMG